MKQNNVSKKLVTIGSAMCLALSLLVSPVASMPSVQAAAPKEDVAQPQHDIIEYRYKIENGKLYKRLYNISNNEWLGEWIYVCDWNY